MDPIFTKPMKIIDTLQKNGYQAYFVGGAVRDLILGRTIGDVDIATSATPDRVLTLFPKTIPVGILHGTVIVLLDDVGYEVTTFRKEEDYLDFRRPTSVTFIDSLTEDQKRRDFTMNAIAMDRDGNLIDPFDGQAAIKKKLIQTVGAPKERFTEDALRMMRAIRFHSQLSFRIEEETKEAIRHQAILLKHVSIERITSELEKILSGHSCQSAMKILVECGLQASIPCLSPYDVVLQEWPSIDYTALQNRTERWALFCYLLKVEDVESFLKSWKLPIKVMKDAKSIMKGLQHLQENDWTDYFMYQLGSGLTASTERIYSILKQLCVEERVTVRSQEYNRLPIHSKSDIVMNGHDIVKLGKKDPGPWINDALNAIEEAILNGHIQNDPESIKEWLVSCNQF